MMGRLLWLFGGSWIIPVIIAVGLAAIGGYIGVLKYEINTQRVTIAEQKVVITEQVASIGVYQQQATNQLERAKEANLAARKSGEAWKRRLAAADKKTEQPPPATEAYAGPLQACTGTMGWLRDQLNSLAEAWNDEK